MQRHILQHMHSSAFSGYNVMLALTFTGLDSILHILYITRNGKCFAGASLKQSIVVSRACHRPMDRARQGRADSKIVIVRDGTTEDVERQCPGIVHTNLRRACQRSIPSSKGWSGPGCGLLVLNPT